MNDVRAVQQQLSARPLVGQLEIAPLACRRNRINGTSTSDVGSCCTPASRTVYALTPAAVASRRVDDTVHVRTRRSIDAHLLHGADRGRVNRTPGTVYTSRAACVGGAGPDSERALVALIYVASNSTRQRPSPRR